MNGFTALIIVILTSLVVGLISGLVVRKWGYSFSRYFVTGFIASCGVMGIVVKIIQDYL